MNPYGDFRRYTLGAFAVTETMNSGHAAIRQALLDYCYELHRRDGGGVASRVAPLIKTNLYESPFNFFGSDLPVVRELKEFCGVSLRRVLQMINDQKGAGLDLSLAVIDIHESWTHISSDGSHHSMHIHPNCSWCGVYYVDAGDCSAQPPNGLTEFYSPFSSTYADFGSELATFSTVKVMPQDGKLVLFPSYLPHASGLYRGHRDRVVVAFNSRVYRR